MEYTLLDKKVQFFKIVTKKNPQNDMLGEPDDDYITVFNNYLINYISDDTKDDEKVRTFEIGKDGVYINFYSVGDNHIFGSIGKISSVKTKPLTEVIKKNDLDYQSLTQEELEEIFIKDFSYFAIDLTNHNCVELVNGHAPGFKKHFHLFISNHVKPVFNANYDIYPIKDNSIDTKLRQIKTLSKVSISMIDLDGNDEILSLSDEYNLSNGDPTKVDVSIKYENTPVNGKSLIDKIKNITNNKRIKKYEVTSKNAYGESETIEVIENLLIKQASIRLNQNDLSQESVNNNIKKALIKELSLLKSTI